MIRSELVKWIIICFLFAGCREKESIPRPRAYPRVEYPEKEYREFSTAECPFSFEYPVYADTINKKEACWFDLEIKSFNAKIHCSYHPISSRADYEDFVKDAYDIADRINYRANYMEETPFKNDNAVGGIILEWTGPAASPIHFFLTDTTQHFFKAALYFNAEVQPDSLAPITEFIKKDIQHMISTFRWEP